MEEHCHGAFPQYSLQSIKRKHTKIKVKLLNSDMFKIKQVVGNIWTGSLQNFQVIIMQW